MSDQLFQEVQLGTALKQTYTVDKSVPLIDSNIHIKKNDHCYLLHEIEATYYKLNPVPQVNDKSAPLIEEDTRIQQHNRAALFNDIKMKAN
ncbi:hypothetical protein SAMD00019534_010810 [Acytostelium subglobosum LB1]|uniref:hypothetical protein n=1 Tax=Acytostelium subglobosum LB1 TaxID=1410327 RepID=UPI000644C2AC|nr:hypothetical protein SAMD00019534_010810 [Acytostelium subglobosum LB1]GAM17906.1 hypothetical protein SAMD00019534_010810 [Acytostelium subglobosum LB1]|eukprot:XP_012758502.1 hypothetical protein SAMD00019534_010810 [Acytostelium subglobosum LB1]